MGAPFFAQGFDQEFQLTSAGARLFTDPSLESFKAAGMKRGVWDTLGPKGWGQSLKTFLAGNRQKGTQGDPWQLGGALVVRQGGEIAFKHVERTPGDQVDLAALQQALAKAAA